MASSECCEACGGMVLEIKPDPIRNPHIRIKVCALCNLPCNLCECAGDELGGLDENIRIPHY
jgi:hypothetical protein